jgi:hypothetical protein
VNNFLQLFNSKRVNSLAPTHYHCFITERLFSKQNLMSCNLVKRHLNILQKILSASFCNLSFSNRKALAAGSLISFISLYLTGCGGSAASTNSGGDSNTNASKAKVIETKIVPAIVREIPKFVQTSGSFIADETTEVAPEIAGKVETVLTGEGAFVEAGSIIIRLSDIDARLRLEQTRFKRRFDKPKQLCDKIRRNSGLIRAVILLL